MANYVAPSLKVERFTCPNCETFAHQDSFDVSALGPHGKGPRQFQPLPRMALTRCQSCDDDVIWYRRRAGEALTVLWPAAGIAPEAHKEMPPDVLSIYAEAGEVGATSPRAAAALLRLALQVLLRELVPDQAMIDGAIAALVREGLDPGIQKAMDVVRVIGNNAVHPGQVDVTEDSTLVPALFALLNLIVEQVVARPKRVAALFDALPTGALEAIERRDGQARSSQK